MTGLHAPEHDRLSLVVSRNHLSTTDRRQMHKMVLLTTAARAGVLKKRSACYRHFAVREPPRPHKEGKRRGLGYQNVQGRVRRDQGMPTQAVSSEQPGASMVEVSSSERNRRGEVCRGLTGD
jgi:hypothetical protein